MMAAEVREFLDFWIENSIHAREQYGTAGAEQGVQTLTRRLIDAAAAQGISEAALTEEIGDIGALLRAKLREANKAEDDRFDSRKP
jgi:hypothetical protein